MGEGVGEGRGSAASLGHVDVLPSETLDRVALLLASRQVVGLLAASAALHVQLLV